MISERREMLASKLLDVQGFSVDRLRKSGLDVCQVLVENSELLVHSERVVALIDDKFVEELRYKLSVYMGSVYTDEELEKLIEFISSPLGQKQLKTAQDFLPTFGNTIAEILRTRVDELELD